METLKKIFSKKENRILVCLFIIGIILLIFSKIMLSLLNIDFSLTKLDGSGIADGYIAVAEGFGLLFKLFGVMIYFLLYFFLPFCASIVACFIGIIARLFKIGENKQWKITLCKVLNVLAVIPYIFITLFILVTLELAWVLNIVGFIVSLATLVVLIGLIVYIFKDNFTKEDVLIVDSKKEIS